MGFAMESETIVEGLRKYGIGAKMRRLRLRKSMGLLELSKHTGLSPALLSKLERDLMHPTAANASANRPGFQCGPGLFLHFGT